MGRKIPGKKHRTVKDPYKQREKHLESLRLKINNPPTNSDEQEIPKSLLRIIQLKEKAKQMSLNKPKKQKKNRPTRRPVKKHTTKLTLPSVANVLDKEPFQPATTKPDMYIPKLVQKPNEPVKSYIRRVSLMTQNLINEVEFEKKFGVEIIKNPENGEVINLKNVKKRNVKSKKKKLCEKRKEKFELKKKDLANIKDFDQLKDHVEFRETVHRPPNLLPLKKGNKSKDEVEKPKYSNLLLHNVGRNVKESENKMSVFNKEKVENERKFIIEAYRKAKKNLNIKL